MSAFRPGIYLSTSTGFIFRWDRGEADSVDIVVSSDIEFTDIAFHPDGTLYAIDFNSLYRIDGATGAPELVGPLSGSLFAGNTGLDGANGFGIGPNGRALVTSFNNSVLASVNLETGAVSNAGLLGQGVRGAGDLFFDGNQVVVSTSSATLLRMGRVLSEGSPTDMFAPVSSTFVGSSELFGLIGSVDGTSGPVGFDRTTAYDLGVPGAVYGDGIGSFVIPGGFLSGAAYLTAQDDVVSVERVSISSNATQGNAGSWVPSISGDGRFVTFYSEASNLVPGDTNGSGDIFVHDRLNGTTERVSVASDGTQGNVESSQPSISADGRFVTFTSNASTLVAGDTSGTAHILVHDRQTGTTERVSISSEGVVGNGWSGSPAISADGRFVAFRSDASNLVDGDGNGSVDVFVHDRLTATTQRVSVATDGSESNGSSWAPSISGDGRFVAFHSLASNLLVDATTENYQVYVHDRVTGTTELVSLSSSGATSNGSSTNPSISSDGRFVAFVSRASNLGSVDAGADSGIFVHDRLTGTTEHVSIASNGAPANGWSGSLSISGDGQFVAFTSNASNLVPSDSNQQPDIFIHDRSTGTTVRASIGEPGVQTDSWSNSPALSSDGQFVAFGSAASNLVSGDTNAASDIFVATNPHHSAGADPTIPVFLQPTFADLEYLARIVAYERLGDVVDGAALPAAYHFRDAYSGYEVELIAEPFLNRDDGFFAVALTSPGEVAAPVLAIRGSATAADWYDNLVNMYGVGEAQFGDAWDSLREWLEANPGAHITGHSQGGAQAQLLAARATAEGLTIGDVATFNSPGILGSIASGFVPSLAGEVRHHIASGDVVSMAGWKYLPGDVSYYNLRSWESGLPSLVPTEFFLGMDIATVKVVNIPAIIAAVSHAARSHTGHWSQPELFDIAIGAHAKPEGHRPTPTQFGHETLSSPMFSHLNAGGEFDGEYWSFVSTAAKTVSTMVSAVATPVIGTAAGATVGAALSTRAGAEALRALPGAVKEGFLKALDAVRSAAGVAMDVLGAMVDFGQAVLDASTEAMRAMYETGVTVAEWTFDTWRGTIGWLDDASAAIWDSVRDWGAEQWLGLTGWTARQWNLASEFTADVWGGMKDWGTDVWESSLTWGVETYNNIKNLGPGVATGIRDAASKVEDAASALGSTAWDVLKGSTTLWGLLSRRDGVEVVATEASPVIHSEPTAALLVGGAGATALTSGAPGSGFVPGAPGTSIEMTGDDNVIFGMPVTLNDSTVSGFGTGDRVIYANMTTGPDGKSVGEGSAIVSVDSDGDGEADTTIRFLGDYDLEAFRLLPHADGMALFYGAPPAEEVAQVVVSVARPDGRPLSGTELALERAFGSARVGETDADGAVTFEVMRGVLGELALTRAHDPALDGGLSPLDALNVLRLVAGLVPADAVAPHLLLAADYNGDGQVTAMDALEILRHVGQFAGAMGPRFVFVPDDVALPDGNDLGPGLTGIPLPGSLPAIDISTMGTGLDIGMTAILSGDLQAMIW